MNKQGEHGIPYCDYTWNPVVGCLHGCSYCFAERIAKRFNCTKAFPDGFAPTFHEKRLGEPERVKKPSRIFVSDMGDLFGEWVPDEWIMKVLSTIKRCPQHTFLLLTKNPKRYSQFEIPKNAWIGTSVDDQAAADKQVPLLLQAGARVRFVSIEPMLGPIDLQSDTLGDTLCRCGGCMDWAKETPKRWEAQRIDWVIVGGESGPNSRPMHPDWVRSLRDQCQGSDVPFLFKQWGEWAQMPFNHPPHGKFGCWGPTWNSEYRWHGGEGRNESVYPGTINMQRVGKKRAGRELDGRTWDEIPSI